MSDTTASYPTRLTRYSLTSSRLRRVNREFLVPAGAGQSHGLPEIRADLAGNVCIAPECDGNVQAMRNSEKLFARIDSLHALRRPAGADFDRHTGCSDRAQRVLEDVCEIGFRSEVKFLRQVGMSQRIEQARGCGLFPQAEILAPTSVHVFRFPVLGAAVDGKFTEVMDAAEKEVPRIHRREFTHPVFASAGMKSTSSPSLIGNCGNFAWRFAHPTDVGFQVGLFHVPVGFAVGQRRVVGAADFVEAALDGDPGVIDGSAGAIGQFGVHMIIDQHGRRSVTVPRRAEVAKSGGREVGTRGRYRVSRLVERAGFR